MVLAIYYVGRVLKEWSSEKPQGLSWLKGSYLKMVHTSVQYFGTQGRRITSLRLAWAA